MEDGFLNFDSCDACGANQWAADGNDWTSCRPWTNCEAGSYVSVQPSSGRDRQCEACGTGTTSTTLNANECSDIDGCIANSCKSGGDGGAVCVDKTAPETGYTCTCSSGFHDQNGECIDVDDCEGHTCASGADTSATCRDTGANNFECQCSDGFVEVGGVCVHHDGCANHPCNTADEHATCTDLLPPQIGNTCNCTSDVFEVSTLADGHQTCVAIDMCTSGTNPCIAHGDTDAICNFDPETNPSTPTYSCTCTEGYEFSNMTCVPYDACAVANDCNIEGDMNARCVDLPPPSSLYRCECSHGFEWREGINFCAEVNGCIQTTENPCLHNGTCNDVIGAHAEGSLGYSCSCRGDWKGTHCEFSDETTCSGHGVVNQEGECSCNTCFAGAHCNECDAACDSVLAYPNCTKSSPSNSESSSSDSAGTTAAIVIVVLVVLAIAAVAVLYLMRRVKEPRRTNVFQQIPDIEGDGFYEPPTPEVIGESDPQVAPFGDKRVVITTQDFIAL